MELQNEVDTTGNLDQLERLKGEKRDLVKLLREKNHRAFWAVHVFKTAEMDVPSTFFFNLEQKYDIRKRANKCLRAF